MKARNHPEWEFWMDFSICCSSYQKYWFQKG